MAQLNKIWWRCYVEKWRIRPRDSRCVLTWGLTQVDLSWLCGIIWASSGALSHLSVIWGCLVGYTEARKWPWKLWHWLVCWYPTETLWDWDGTAASISAIHYLALPLLSLVLPKQLRFWPCSGKSALWGLYPLFWEEGHCNYLISTNQD